MTHRTIRPGSVIQPSPGETRGKADIGLVFESGANIRFCFIEPAEKDLGGWRETESKCPEILDDCDPDTGITSAQHLDLYRVRLVAMRVRLAIVTRRQLNKKASH